MKDVIDEEMLLESGIAKLLMLNEGVEIEFTPEEAEALAAFHDNALSEEEEF